MIKLYYHPYSRAARVRWMLEEIGEPYELVHHDFAGDDSDLRKVHPLAKIPAIVDGSLRLFESAAIVMHLADSHPSKDLAPRVGTPERALYYQWILFATTEVEPHIVQYWIQTDEDSEKKRCPEEAEAARASYSEAAAVLEKHLSGEEFLVASRFSAADVLLGAMLDWGGQLGLLEGFPRLAAYAKALGARPAAKRARAE